MSLRQQVFCVAVCFCLCLGPFPVVAQEGEKEAAQIQKWTSQVSHPQEKVRFQALVELAKVGKKAKGALVRVLVVVESDGSAKVRSQAIRTAIAVHTKAEEVVDTLVRTLADPDVVVRSTGASALARLGKVALPKLKDALTSPRSLVRFYAVKAIGEMGRPAGSAVVMLVDRWKKDRDGDVRVAAIDSLGKMARFSPYALVVVRLALRSDRMEAVRLYAARALAKLGGAGRADLMRALEQDESPQVRVAAARGLGRPGGKEVDKIVSLLVKSLEDKHLSVRKGAAYSLVRLGKPAVSKLAKGLASEKWPVRYWSAWALGQMKEVPSETIGKLSSLLADNEWAVREAAVTALGRLAPHKKKVVEDLVDALADKTPYVRRAAVKALGQVKKEKFTSLIPHLMPILRDQDQVVRHQVIQTFQNQGATAWREVARYLHKANPNHRTQAAWALGYARSDEKKWISHLLQVVHSDPFWLVRKYAALSLGRLGKGSKKSAASLVKALKDRDPRVREGAAEGLGKVELGTTDVIAGLTSALSDKSAEVQKAAALALGALGKKGRDGANQLIAVMMKDKNPHLKLRAAWALSRMGEAVWPALERGLDREKGRNRWYLMVALYKMESPPDRAVKKLVSLVKGDQNRLVRKYAALTLARMGNRARSAMIDLQRAYRREKNESVKKAIGRAVDEIRKG